MKISPKWKNIKILYPVLGLLALGWFLVRVVPKPSRASYPCMRAAMPMASGFVIWLLGIAGSVLACRKSMVWFRQYRYARAAIFIALAVAGASLFNLAANSPWALAAFQTEILVDPVNQPMGEPKGIHPGRVVWVHDTEATDWDGPESDQPCWSPVHTNQTIVDSMMSRAVHWLAGTRTDSAAWEALFRHFNNKLGNGDHGYRNGEKISIKINLVTSNCAHLPNPESRIRTTLLDKAADTSPQMVQALLRQLVYVAGVAQTDIAVGDPGSYFPQQWYDQLAGEFPNVTYLDHYAYPGRQEVRFSSTPLYWSTSAAQNRQQDYLPLTFAEADYMINFAALKGHSAGISAAAKNHYGSLIRNPVGYLRQTHSDFYDLHDSLPHSQMQPGRGHYRALVDLMGHRELGGKTLLYLIDGLYGGYYWDGTPYRWAMAPFNGDWPSSLFVSQDPVAIDSVAHDFLKTEWPDVVSGGDGAPGSLQGGAQDYLHEAAMAGNPPSGTTYDPESDGTILTSLGVHEHWNNATDKAYSVNLGATGGIELILSDPSIPPDPNKGVNLIGVYHLLL